MHSGCRRPPRCSAPWWRVCARSKSWTCGANGKPNTNSSTRSRLMTRRRDRSHCNKNTPIRYSSSYTRTWSVIGRAHPNLSETCIPQVLAICRCTHSSSGDTQKSTKGCVVGDCPVGLLLYETNLRKSLMCDLPHFRSLHTQSINSRK